MTHSQQLRRVVLKLAAAHPRDRRWLLAQLTGEQRRRVQGLLGELEAMGIRDAAACARMLEEHPVDNATAAGAHPHADSTTPPHGAIDTATWSQWLRAQPQTEQWPFNLRVLISEHGGSGIADGDDVSALTARVPPAWLPALREFLAEAPA